MDSNSIPAKTAKGIAAKPENENLHYDAVRLMRLINGRASVSDLRSSFGDLTDARFEKALVSLQRSGLVRMLEVAGQDGLDAGIRELEQEIMQSLDFTSLQRTLINAIRYAPGATATPAPTATRAHPAATQPVIESSKLKKKVRSPGETLPTADAEMRTQLIAALRPKVEKELRATLASALRPALEAEIRSKLIIALKPRVEFELRARLKDQLANSSATAADIAVASERLLECLQESVFQIDIAGKSAYVNPAWTRLTGVKIGDTIGKRFAEFFIVEDQKSVALFLDRIARGKETRPWLDASVAREAGGPIIVKMRAALLTTESGDPIGVCGTLTPARARQKH